MLCFIYICIFSFQKPDDFLLNQQQLQDVRRKELSDLNSLQNLKKSQIQNKILAEHLSELFQAEYLPPWTYGLDRLPSYVLPISDEFLQMKKRHAQETIRVIERELRLKSQLDGQEFERKKFEMQLKRNKENTFRVVSELIAFFHVFIV